MFKENNQHLQPYLISNINDLPEKQRRLLGNSWAGTFYQEVFCRIDEQLFSELYVDFPSRPNAPVNELVSLEILKAGQGWTDEEMWHHYLFDLQTRYALGLEQLGEAHFDLRTVYNFRERLSRPTWQTRPSQALPFHAGPGQCRPTAQTQSGSPGRGSQLTSSR
jgi:hypothetical protein